MNKDFAQQVICSISPWFAEQENKMAFLVQGFVCFVRFLAQQEHRKHKQFAQQALFAQQEKKNVEQTRRTK